MNKALGKAAIAIALAGITANALAHPNCRITKSGDKVTVRVIDTGVVYTGGNKPPEGVQSYPGTGRAGDISVSCKDASDFCAKSTFYARPADARQGWPGDDVLDSDNRVIKGSYDPKGHAMVFTLQPTRDMRTKDNKLRLHFSAKTPDGKVVAAYQPQAGACKADSKSSTGDPHAVVQ